MGKNNTTENIEGFLKRNGFRLETYYGTHKRYCKNIAELEKLYVRVYSDANKIAWVEYGKKEINKYDIESIMSFSTVDTLEKLVHLLKALDEKQ